MYSFLNSENGELSSSWIEKIQSKETMQVQEKIFKEKKNYNQGADKGNLYFHTLYFVII